MVISHYRSARGMTQQELARRAGVSLGTVRDIEQGRTRQPSWTVLEGLATALRLDQRQRAELTAAGRPAQTAGGTTGWPLAVAPVARIAVLGPMTIRREGALVPAGPQRQRVLLGLLALHNGVGVHRDVIVDVLWGAHPTASAGAQVHGYVSRLRRLLGPARPGRPGLLVTDGAGYRLAAAEDQLDLAAFGQLLEIATGAASAGCPELACDLYEQALALWRGDLLAGLDQLREHPTAVELAHQRSDAVLGFAEAALRSGAPQRPVSALRGLCEREPFNEAAHARLMTALAASGHQAAALDAFSRLSRQLAEELGLCPGPELARVHLRVLRQQVPLPGSRVPGLG